MNIRYDGKCALVTGGSRGLGREIAMQMAESGADIVLVDMLEEESEKTCNDLRALGVNASYYLCDVSDMAQVQKVFDSVDKIDVVVHAAAITLNRNLLDATQEEIKRIFDVNILGSSNVAQAAMQKMIPQKQGAILLLASVAGKQSQALLTHYRMSKAAVISLAMSAAYNGAPHGIRVNAICPGIIRTAMWEKMLDERMVQQNKPREQIWEEVIEKLIPLGHPQTERDIAYTAVFLCSDFAKEITGQSWCVDGGQCMQP